MSVNGGEAMRLIDADELIHLYFDDEDGKPVFDFVPWEFVENAPTIEAEPVKHGRWITEGLVDGNQNRYCRCSECGKGDTQAISQRVPYCWYCGADMRGGENGI